MALEAPSVPVTERTTVPVSALFSEAELTMPESPTPPARENDLNLEVKPPAKPAEAAPAAAAAAPAKPAEAPATAPAKPAEAAPAAAAAAPAKLAEAPAVKPKIKIGDKEYTEQELEQALTARNTPVAPQAAAAPVAPAPAPVKPPSPEEIATAESAWQEKFIADEKLTVPVSEKDLEAILTGDKDGVALLGSKLNSVVAKAVMLARKSIYQELNPVIGALQSNLQPVLVNAQQVEAAAAEHQFFTAYPDFKGHADTVRRVGEALLTRFPKECQAMSREQLLAEVASQSDRIIQAECERFAPGKNWRQLQQAPAAAPAAPAAATAPAVVPAAAAPSAPAAPAVRPPASNSPAATGTGTDAGKNWHKDTASSLRG